MGNAWNVIWFKEGKKYIKAFEGEKPRESGAIDYGKELKRRGIIQVYVVSRRRGFAPPLSKLSPPQVGMIWCPYCLAWREFIERAILHDGLRGPVLSRCPICTISIHDYYIRKYNGMMVARLEYRSESRQNKKVVRR